jgi:hypothetical protein
MMTRKNLMIVALIAITVFGGNFVYQSLSQSQLISMSGKTYLVGSCATYATNQHPECIQQNSGDCSGGGVGIFYNPAKCTGSESFPDPACEKESVQSSGTINVELEHPLSLESLNCNTGTYSIFLCRQAAYSGGGYKCELYREQTGNSCYSHSYISYKKC